MNLTDALLRAVPISMAAALFVAMFTAVAKWLGSPLAAAFEHALWVCVLATMLAFAIPKIKVHAGPPVAPATVHYTAPVGTLAATPSLPAGVSISKPERVSPTSSVWFAACCVVWMVVAVVMALRIFVGMFLTRRSLVGARRVLEEDAIRCAVPNDARLSVAVEESDNAVVPMTFGWPFARIVLPPTWRLWPQEKLLAVLAHELAHVRRRDALVTFLAAFNKAIFWFHPMAWWIERRLAELAEFAADETAVEGTMNRQEYAAVLLEIASSAGPVRLRWNHASVEFARRGANRINRRLDRILDSGTRAGSAKVVGVAATVIAVLSFVQFERPVRAQEPTGQERAHAAVDSGNATASQQPEDPDAARLTQQKYQQELLRREAEQLHRQMADLQSGQQGQPAQQRLEDAMKKLEELARRQQELAGQEAQEQLAQQRYQEERREAEQLRRQMANLQNSQQWQSGQQQREDAMKKIEELVKRQQELGGQEQQERLTEALQLLRREAEQVRQEMAQLNNTQQDQPQFPQQVGKQDRTKRLVRLTVTDPMGRFVTGLEQETFEIVENGVHRPITDFAGADAPLSLAIVSETPLEAGSLHLNGELIQTRSASDALRQLSASKSVRKAIVVTTAIDTQEVPAGIQVVQASPDGLLRAVVELRNQYSLQFETANPYAGVEVILGAPRGLPALRANLK